MKTDRLARPPMRLPRFTTWRMRMVHDDETGYLSTSQRFRYRSRLRASVRALMAFVLVLGAGLGWTVKQAKVQCEAVAEVTGAGGFVIYDWQWVNGEYRPERSLRWPRWLVQYAGVDYFSNVVKVGLTARASDSQLMYIGRLRRLRELDIDGSSAVTDSGMAHLSRLVELEHLNVSNSSIGDAGLAHMKGLVHLKQLWLGNTKVSDAGIAHLEGLSSLESLLLTKTAVGDAGLAHLRRLKDLRELRLGWTRVTDAGMRHLGQLHGLVDLYLDSTAVGDAGLTHLTELPHLAILLLSKTEVTDAGLDRLAGLTHLSFLALDETQVTIAGIGRIRKALPEASVSCSYDLLQ